MSGDATFDRRKFLAGVAGTAGAAVTPVVAQVAVQPSAPAINRSLPDVVVVGAGAFGGWTALTLRERGAKVTLVDVYGPGNPRAASGDVTRSLRASYGDREIYSRWATKAQSAWESRQESFGRRLFYPNGSLRVLSDERLAAQRRVFDKLNLKYEVLTNSEVHHRWPQVRYDDVEALFYEHGGGLVKARESMIAVAESFMRKGGEVRIGHAVPGERSNGRLTNVLVDGEPLAGAAFVFACGPWLPKLMPDLLGDRILVPRRELFYIGSPVNDRRYRWEHLPNLSDHDTYAHSDTDYGYKVAARLPDIAFDPDTDERIATPFLTEQVTRYIAKRLPGLVGQPVVGSRVCQTEYSDNNHFIIDTHPDFANAWIAGAGSGHAFKMGPVLGEYVADRVLGEPEELELKALFELASHGSAL
jgi:sarcosine oxidase